MEIFKNRVVVTDCPKSFHYIKQLVEIKPDLKSDNLPGLDFLPNNNKEICCILAYETLRINLSQ